MDAMSPRARIFLLVAGAAVLAAGVVVVGVLATRSDVPTVKPRPGSPPLALDLGIRADPEAQALRNAETLYDRDRQGRPTHYFDWVDLPNLNFDAPAVRAYVTRVLASEPWPIVAATDPPSS